MRVRRIIMRKMGKRKKQILNQIIMELLFLVVGIGVGFLAMFIIAIIV